MHRYKVGTILSLAIALMAWPSGNLSAKKRGGSAKPAAAAPPAGNDAGAHSARGMEAEKNQQYDTAIAEFTKAIEAQPREARHYYNRATAYRGAAKLDEALADFTKSTELAPQDVVGYIGRGEVEIIQRKLEAAITDFNKALEMAPNNLSVRRFRAFTYRSLKKFPEALADYSKIIEMTGKKDPETYRQRGVTYSMAGDKQKAGEDFRALLKLKPDDADAQARLKLLESGADNPPAPATTPGVSPAATAGSPAPSPH